MLTDVRTVELHVTGKIKALQEQLQNVDEHEHNLKMELGFSAEWYATWLLDIWCLQLYLAYLNIWPDDPFI